jgi:ammonium transporter
MMPGLALFYGGMVSARNVLVMLQQNIVPMGILSLVWVILGYSLAFGQDSGAGLLGNFELFGLSNLDTAPAPAMHVVVEGIAIPTLAFVAYQMMFAIITPALITGATADRLRFGAYALFITLWSLIVYVPVAHWLFNPGGWLATMGAQDWAGGLVVHASAGAAVFAILMVIGKRRRWPNASRPPHSIPMVVLGAGILWFGWFGFNAGDGLRVDGVAAQALINTQIAAASAMVVWLLIERMRDGHSTVLGGVTGAIAGLATVTPLAGYISTYSALAVGVIAALICQWALGLKWLVHLDDALDVIAVHFTGGVIGTLLVGVFGEADINPIGKDGLIFGGGFTLLGHQAIATVSVVAFSFCATWIIATIIQRTIGLRVDPKDESNLDHVQQGATAYAYGRSSDIMQAELEPVPAIKVPDAAAEKPGTMRSVTVLIDDTDVDEVRTALMAAGATTIALSDASVYERAPDGPKKEIVRGSSRTVEFHPRLRLEIVVPKDQIPEVVAALRHFDGVGDYVQVTDLNLMSTGGS